MARKKQSVLQRFCKYIEFGPRDSCWNWTGGKMPKGYGIFNYDKSRLAHRASYSLFKGDIPDGMNVCHKCDNPQCTNPDHLFLGTQKDNLADMTRKGRRVNAAPKGERHGRAKLTLRQVSFIKSFLRRHVPFQGQKNGPILFLAGWMNVKPYLIRQINNNTNWREVA